jgi:hypothetical protein
MRPFLLVPIVLALASMACQAPEIYLVSAAPAIAEGDGLRMQPQVLDPFQVQSIFGGASGSWAAGGGLLVLNLEIENLESRARTLERSMFRLLRPDGRFMKPKPLHTIAVGSGGGTLVGLLRSYELHQTLKGWMDKTCEVQAQGRTQYLLAFIPNDATPGTWILELEDGSQGSRAHLRVALPLVPNPRSPKAIAPGTGD